MGHPRFTEDFKADAVKQITERGHSVSDVSQRLGVSTHSARGLVKMTARQNCYVKPGTTAARFTDTVSCMMTCEIKVRRVVQTAWHD